MTNHSISRRLLATVLCLLAMAMCRDSYGSSDDRPFSWLSAETGQAASLLRRALSVPGLKCMVQEMTSDDAGRLYLDMRHSFGIRNEESFRAKAYEVLDAAVSAERRLEEARRAAGGDGRHGAAYYFLKYRLRFAQALCKVEVSRRMAAADSSYCMQAMESAIDCLKASAEARDEFEKLRGRQGYGRLTDPSAKTIRAFRGELLRIWESSKSRGSSEPILAMDVGEALNRTMVSGVKEKKAQKRIGDLFAWLGTDSAGNHAGPEPVE